MADDAGEKMAEGKLDLVPMIDCVMLLLLFFILTTKFTTEEKSISSLLPTDKGQAPSRPSKLEPPKQVNILIYPDGMEKGKQPSGYQKQLEEMRLPGAVIPSATLRVGGNLIGKMDGPLMNRQKTTEQIGHINWVHSELENQLAAYEQPGDRKGQQDIVINCFSGLSWKFSLVVYDAVRAYEAKKSGVTYTGDPRQLDESRGVTFAPPRIRNYDARELGNELFEIINMK